MSMSNGDLIYWQLTLEFDLNLLTSNLTYLFCGTRFTRIIC